MNDDISETVTPKSDQLNADDLIDGRGITITITGMTVKKGTEQPAAINYEGDNGKPYKPCLSMRRLMLILWGSSKDGAYIGRKLRLYNDKKVRFGPDVTGGIRISHMSHITQTMTVPLTSTRGKRSPYTVHPLVEDSVRGTVDVAALKKAGLESSEKGLEALKAWWTGIGGASQKAIGGAPYLEEMKTIAAKYSGSVLPSTENNATDETPQV